MGFRKMSHQPKHKKRKVARRKKEHVRCSNVLCNSTDGPKSNSKSRKTGIHASRKSACRGYVHIRARPYVVNSPFCTKMRKKSPKGRKASYLKESITASHGRKLSAKENPKGQRRDKNARNNFLWCGCFPGTNMTGSTSSFINSGSSSSNRSVSLRSQQDVSITHPMVTRSSCHAMNQGQSHQCSLPDCGPNSQATHNHLLPLTSSSDEQQPWRLQYFLRSTSPRYRSRTSAQRDMKTKSKRKVKRRPFSRKRQVSADVSQENSSSSDVCQTSSSGTSSSSRQRRRRRRRRRLRQPQVNISFLHADTIPGYHTRLRLRPTAANTDLPSVQIRTRARNKL